MIVEINEDNFQAAAELSVQLWPDCDLAEMRAHFKDVMQSDEATCFLLQSDAHYVGFIELSIRKDHVEGAEAVPVPYVEGLFIEEGFRHKGFGRLLVEAAEAWARVKGFTQICSDTELENNPSIAFHKSVGFREATRIVCFVKNLY
jgi:aminoglycoside 6'-N-acetyltransferase I